MLASSGYWAKANEALERSDRATQTQTKRFFVTVALVYVSLADREERISVWAPLIGTRPN